MSDRKFILESAELGRVTLADDPIGWDAVKKQFFRNMELIGVFRKRTAALKFVGDGLQYCIDLNVLTGTESILTVIVLQKKDYEDDWILEYEGIGKFNPFDLEWDDDLSPSLHIEFEDSGFHNKFLTRRSMLINIGNETAIDGLDIGPMTTKDIQVHQRTIIENNHFELSENDSYYGSPGSLPEPYILANGGHVVPAEKLSGDTDFVETATDYSLTSPGLMVDFLTQPAALKITWAFAAIGRVVLDLSGNDIKIGWYIRKFTDSTDLSVFTDIPLFEDTKSGTPSEEITFNHSENGTYNIDLNVGEALSLVFVVDIIGSASEGVYDMVYSICNVDVQLIQNFDEYASKGHYRFEFMKRLVQLITNQEDCFDSNVFGRTELGYNVNGAYSNNALFSGKQLRGFEDTYPVWSFQKSFKSARSIWNLGCGIEKRGSLFRVVVEELPYFFDGRISITLHNVTKLKRQVNETLTYSEVRSGYEKAEYEKVNGLEEYNNKMVHATFIKSDENVLDLLSPERADGYGMEFARRKSKFVAATEDTPYDNELFTAMVNETAGVLKTQKDENYSLVENIQSPETATNLDITPQRNLIRNGDWIKGCVNKYPLEYLRFVSADKETDLSSVRTGETGVVEQTSIQNKDLLSSLWLNQNYLFEAAITPEEVNRMEKMQYRLIKFSPFDRAHTKKYFYGWIIDVAVGGKDRTGSFTLLAANINSDRLRIIDPDGIDDTSEQTPLPPSTDEAGFEYSFEKVFES